MIFTDNTFRRNVHKWFFVWWDEKYLLSHKLSTESIVFEVWWYTGVYTKKLINKYNCTVYVFEPVKEFFDILKKEFQDNPKIHLFQFWLSDTNKEEKIYKTSDGTSLYRKNIKEYEIIQLVNIDDFLKEAGFNATKNIDLIQINIEGWEYSLLPKILETNPNTFKTIQVQFHDFIQWAKEKRENILTLLKENNYIKWFSFPFVRELFIKKN